MFTDRFIKVPVDLYNNKEAELIGYNNETKSTVTDMSLLAFEISHYRVAVNDNEEYVYTLIHMKNGDSFHASITVTEFEKILNEHQK